jgi:glutathione S-transferase
MSLMLYAHHFSSYCQKVLVALWENNTPFTYRHLEEPGVGAELTELWPIGKFPVLIDEGRTIAENQHHHRASGPAASREGAVPAG